MKAKEYLARFRQDEEVLGFEVARRVLCELMFQEILEIIKTRLCKYAGAVESVLDEMNDRWNAMVKIENRFVRDACRQEWFRDLDGRGLFAFQRETSKDPVDNARFE